VPATLNPAAVQDDSNKLKIVEIILNVAANSDIAKGSQKVFNPEEFKSGIVKLICYYGNDANGNRYLIEYADCASKMKVNIAEIIPYDDIMKAIVNPPQGEGSEVEPGRTRRASDVQTLVRFYVYSRSLENMLEGDEVVQASVRAPETFLETEFGYNIDDAWTIGTRNGASSLLTDDDDTAAVEEAANPNTLLWGVVVGVLAVAMFSLVGVVLWAQRGRNKNAAVVTWDKAFSDNGSLAGISDWDGVARALADHGLDAGSGWGGEGGGNGYERVLGLLSGAASVAPSTNYLDVTRKDLQQNSPRTALFDEQVSSHYNPAINLSRSITPAFGSNVPAQSLSNVMQSEMEDGYLALDSEELNAPVSSGLAAATPSTPPPYAKLDNLLAMKAACDAQLEELSVAKGDNFDDATRQMLAFTQQSLNLQVNEFRKSQSPDFAEMSPLPEATPDGGGGHYYPTQIGLGVEPVVSTTTVPVHTAVGMSMPQKGPTHFVPGESLNRPTLAADDEFTTTINGLGGN